MSSHNKVQRWDAGLGRTKDTGIVDNDDRVEFDKPIKGNRGAGFRFRKLTSTRNRLSSKDHTVVVQLAAPAANTQFLPVGAERFDGQQIVVCDGTGDAETNPITIEGGDKLINGASTHVVRTNGGQVTYVFSEELDEWRVVNVADRNQVTVANFTALGQVAGSLSGATAPRKAFVTGRVTARDGGEGPFLWKVGSTTPDGGTLVAGPAGSGGYWQREYEGVPDSRWFGAKNDGTTDDTAATAAARDANGLSGGDLNLGVGSTVLDRLGNGAGNMIMRGKGYPRTRVIPKTDYAVYIDAATGYDRRFFFRGYHLEFNGAAKTKSGVYVARDASLLLDGVTTIACDKGVHGYGSFGNSVNDSNLDGNNYGYFGQSVPTVGPLTGAQCGLLSMYNTSMRNNTKAGLYLDGTNFFGGVVHLAACDVESNAGFGVFIKHLPVRGAFAGAAILDSVWLEGNALDPTPIAMADGNNYVPADVHVDFGTVAIRGGQLTKVSAQNYGIVCVDLAEKFEVVKTDNTVIWDLQRINGDASEFDMVVEHPLDAGPGRPFLCRASSHKNITVEHESNLVPQGACTAAAFTVANGGTQTVVSGGVGEHNKCLRLLLKPGAPYLIGNASAISIASMAMSADKFYVVTFACKRVSGATEFLFGIQTGAAQLYVRNVPDEWRTYTMMCQPISTNSENIYLYGVGADITIDMSRLQVTEFTTRDAAYRFAGKDFYARPANMSKRDGVYTVVGLPTAVGNEGRTVYVSNETGGPVPAFSDNINWRRVWDGQIVS